MSSRLIRWLFIAACACVVLAVGAFVGVNIYLTQRNQSWLTQAEGAYARGEWERAIGFYERYLPQDKANAALLKKYAEACLHILDNRRAMQQKAAVAYQQVLTYHDEPETLKTLVELYKTMGAWSTLAYYSEEALRTDPDNELLNYNHALALDQMGQRDDAIAAYRDLADANTAYADVYANLARLLRDRDLVSQADDVLAQAIEHRPEDARIRVHYARFLARQQDFTKADAMLAEAINLAPDDPEVLAARAQMASQQQNFGEAVEFLNGAIEGNPTEPSFYLMLASAYTNLGQPEAAVDAILGIDVVTQVDNPPLLITLIDLQLGLKQFEDAKNSIELYRRANPGQLPMEEYFAAKELLVKGDAEGAVKQLAPVVELRPGFLLAQYTLAVAYMEAGEDQLARSTLEAYLARNPADVRARQLLNQRFGKPQTISSIERSANVVLGDANADGSALLAAGAALYSASLAEGTIESHAKTIDRLLSLAAEKLPDSPEPCEGLVDVRLARGDIQGAQAAIDAAISAGVSPDALALSQSAIALAQQDVEKAEALMRSSLQAAALTQDDVLRWSEQFSSYGHADLAQTAIDIGIERLQQPQFTTSLKLEQILIALRAGDARQAIDRIDRLNSDVPRDSPLRNRFNAVRLQVAQSLLADRQLASQAAQILERVRDEDPNNAALGAIDGLLLLRNEPPDYAGAEERFKASLNEDPNNLTAEWGLARIALAQDDFGRAQTHAQRAVALAPRLPAIQILLGEVMLRLGRHLEAENILKRVLDVRPDDTAALQLLLASFVERNQSADAQRVLSRLEPLAVSDPDLQASLAPLRGRLLLAAGNSSEALAELREQVAAHPDDFDAVQNLAVALNQTDNKAEAEHLLQSYAENHSSSPEPWVSLARLHMSGEGERAAQNASTALTRALLIDPDYVPALREMLGIQLRLNNRVEALGLCERYLAKNPDDGGMLNTKAILLAETAGQLRPALEAATQAIECDDRPEFRATRGIILVALKDYPRALLDLQTAALTLPETGAQFDAAIAEAYMNGGELELARQYYNSAVEKVKRGEPFSSARLESLGNALAQRESQT